MRSKVPELQARREALAARAREILSRAERESRGLTSGERGEYERQSSEIENLNAKIEQTRRSEDAHHRALEGMLPLVVADYSGSVYRPDAGHSYLADLARRQLFGDASATSRLAEYESERRDISRVDGSGGEFVPPSWLLDQYAAPARAGRVMADRMRPFLMPPGTDTINVPRITTGTLTGVQTADNQPVVEQDMVTASVALPVRTIAGQQDVAIQLIEQSPVSFDQVVFADLLADYYQKLDAQILSGTGASGQILGILNTAGTLSVNYADGAPSVAHLYPQLAGAINQMASTRYMPPTSIVMHPRRWSWFLAALDAQDRPLVVPAASAQNAAGIATGLSPNESVGTLLGLPVYLDANIPTNLGTGTNEDRIFLLRGEDHFLFESPPRLRILPDVGSANLTIRLQLYGYCAFTAARYPSSTVVVSGVGLVTPSF